MIERILCLAMEYLEMLQGLLGRVIAQTFIGPFVESAARSFARQYSDPSFKPGDLTVVVNRSLSWKNIYLNCEKITNEYGLPFKLLQCHIKLLEVTWCNPKPIIEVNGLNIIITQLDSSVPKQPSHVPVLRFENHPLLMPLEDEKGPFADAANLFSRLESIIKNAANNFRVNFKDIFLAYTGDYPENQDESMFIALTINSACYECHGAKKYSSSESCIVSQYDMSIDGIRLLNFRNDKSVIEKSSKLIAEMGGTFTVVFSVSSSQGEDTVYHIMLSCDALIVRISPMYLNLMLNLIEIMMSMLKDPATSTNSSESDDKVTQSNNDDIVTLPSDDDTANEDVPINEIIQKCDSLSMKKQNHKLKVEFTFLEVVIAILYKNPSDKNPSDPIRLDDKHSALKFFSMLRDAPVSHHAQILDSYDCEEDEDHFLVFVSNLEGKLLDFPEMTCHYQNVEFSASRIHISESLSTIPSGRNKKKHDIFEVPAKESTDEKKFELSLENNGPSLKIKCSSPGLQVGLDLSLTERLQYLFEICAPRKTTKQITPGKISTPIKYIVASVTIPYALIQLWFPVPTFEEVETLNVLNQGFREDYLSLELRELNLKVQMKEKNNPDKPLVIMKIKNIHGLFHECIVADASSILHLEDTECVLWTPPKSSVFEDYNDLVNGPLCHGIRQLFGLKLCPEIPVGKAKMTKFVNDHAKCSIHYLTIKSNGLSLYLPSKNILEILYNRLLSDLVLWQPQKSRLSTNLEPDLSIKDKTTSLSLEMQISSVSIFARTPYRNHLGVVVPDTNGEILIRMKDAKLVVLAEFLGDPNMFYTILEVPDSVSLKHNPKQEAPTQLLYPSFKIDEDSFKEVVTSDIKSMIIGDDSHECDQALSVVIKTHFDPVLNLSSVKVIGQCDRLTIRHYMEMPSSGWVSQLIDLLNLEDYPVQGYILPNVRNECQFSCHRMQLDYIPELLSYATRVIASTVNVKVAAETGKPTVIDLLVRQLVLAMAQKKEVLACRDYVGLLKIPSFASRVGLGAEGLKQVDIRLNEPQMCVCADSLAALMSTVKYISADGDLDANSFEIPTEVVQAKESHVAVIDIGHGPGIHNSEGMHLMKEQMEDALQDLPQPAQGSNADQLRPFEIVDYEGEDRKPSRKPTTSLGGDLYHDCLIPVDNTQRCIVTVHNSFTEGEHWDEEYTDMTKLAEKEARQEPLYKTTYFHPDVDKVKQATDSKCVITLELSSSFEFYGGSDFLTHAHESPEKVTLDSNILSEFKVQSPSDWLRRGGHRRDLTKSIKIVYKDIWASYNEYEAINITRFFFKLRVSSFWVEDRVLDSKVKTMVSGSFKQKDSRNVLKLSVKRDRSFISHVEYDHTIAVETFPLDVVIDQYTLKFLETFASIAFGDDDTPVSVQPGKVSPPTSGSDLPSTFYIKSFTMSPPTYIRFTYNAQGLDMHFTRYSFQTIARCIANVHNCEIALKRVDLTHLETMDVLFNELFKIWTKDIRDNQTTSMLKGFEAVNVFVNLYEGVRDLLCLPIAQYQTDGRVLTGIRRGTNSFAYSSTHALLDLSGRLASGVQSVAEILHDVLSVRPHASKGAKRIHPADVSGGIYDACRIVREGMGETATAIVSAAATEHAERGIPGAVGGFLRQIPPSVVQPVIVATEAAQTILGGMKNQLTPNAGQEARIKWKS